MSSSTDQAAPPPGKGPAGAAASEPATSAGAGGTWAATAALVCGILGGALVTIPAGLVLGVLGLRRARRAPGGGPRRPGLVRSWVAIGLSLAWAGAAGYLLPYLIRAADPGCMAYKDTALTSYNRVVADVRDGAGPGVLVRDLTTAIRDVDRAAQASREPAATRSLGALSAGLRTVLSDVRAGADVPRRVLLTLNRDTDTADTACGTVRL